jgi:hypothetical protein
MKIPERILNMGDDKFVALPKETADEYGVDRRVSVGDLKKAVEKKKAAKKKSAKKEVKPEVVEKLDNMEKPQDESNL